MRKCLLSVGLLTVTLGASSCASEKATNDSSPPTAADTTLSASTTSAAPTSTATPLLLTDFLPLLEGPVTVGACYSAGSVADIVDCEELHDGQVLRSGVRIPPGLLSSDSEKETISLIESTCVPYFKPFVGSDWDPVAGRFTIWAALETGSTDSLVCSVVSSDGELWAGSAENFVGSYEGVELGDCFDFPTDVNDAVVLPCSAPHEAEMFVLNAPIPGITAESSYPSDDDWDLFGSEVCDVAFESFTGRSVDDPELSYYIIYPLEADWYDATLRTLSCAAASYDGTKLSESVRG